MATDDYLQRLTEVLRSLRLPRGTATHVWIYHDDGCAFWRAAVQLRPGAANLSGRELARGGEARMIFAVTTQGRPGSAKGR